MRFSSLMAAYPQRQATAAPFARMAGSLLLTLAALVPVTAGAQSNPTTPVQSAASTPAASPVSIPASRQVAPGFPGLKAGDKVVLMPADVELFELSAGGVLTPKADWTASAQKYMALAIGKRKSGWNLMTQTLSEADADEFSELVGLQAAVARSIALHHLSQALPLRLPSKADQLNWNLGDAMRPLAAKTGARYGLFIWMRDSYASAERKALMVGMALLGVAVSSGVQFGYASLVDLETGQVVWMNQVSGLGDLRDEQAAAASVNSLFTGFPVLP